MYKAAFDRVAQSFSGSPYTGEFNVAREDYFRRTGKVFQDDPLFETRMTSFLEWYLLDRLLWDSGIPPVRLHRLKCRDMMDEGEVGILLSLETSVHSLFLMSGLDRNRYLVEDLRSGERMQVSERHAVPGAHRGDILDARIVTIGEESFFSDALWVHPADAGEFITAEAKAKRKEGEEEWRNFLFDLAYMKLKRERFEHVPTSQIYDWNLFARDRAETDRRSAHLSQGAE
jgi:hypothetical protein